MSASTSSSPIQVLIIGAGLAGLGAAISIHSPQFQVSVIESTRELAEVGAGVQITPQTVNQFKRWGIDKALEPLAAVPKFFTINRYSDGKVLAEDKDWSGWMEREFGSPVWDLHRADMQKAMFDKAKEMGVKFTFGANVDTVDCENAEIKLKSGETLSADLIIAADGLWSKARQSMLGRVDVPTPTGDLAYRIVLNEDEIPDPELREMMTNPGCRLFAGPRAHTIIYSLKGGKQMNIVLLVPDDLPPEARKQAGDVGEMMKLFDDWDPKLKRFLGLVKGVEKWRLNHHHGLESWHHPSGKMLCIGDAVHPMLPYLAQGANSAIEDGVVLGECLHKAGSKDQILTAIKVFEKIRKPRSDWVVALTHKQRHWNHLEDGEEQRERDAHYEQQMKDGRDGDFKSAWINPNLWGTLCSYDPVGEVAKNYDRLAGEIQQNEA